MVDFKNLVKQKKSEDVTDLLKLFNALDRQTSHTDLRSVQLEVLNELNTRRRERDTVLKISTGAGKTSIGLLYLQSHMLEKDETVLYLCPTIQLVEQVLNEATKLGLNAVQYPHGEPHPSVEGISRKAIIVCTYDKLFNAKTTFDRPDVLLRPCAIVLDDAHAGVEEIRDSFTLKIEKESNAYEELTELLGSQCGPYQPGSWNDIMNGDKKEYLEVPFWIWKPLLESIQAILMKHAEESNFIFVWPFLRDMLRWCRCIISGAGIEIIPDVLPIEKNNAFTNAKHRLFMSATLSDDSVLIRELGCEFAAAKNPVLPLSDKGLGERMVLAPVLVSKKMDRKWVMEFCSKLPEKIAVVVLCSNEQMAKEWMTFGAQVVLGGAVSEAVKKLKDPESKSKFFVFVQRYDGVDLPDNSCRILVMDGMPYGEGVTDKHDSDKTMALGGTRNRVVYRIEQGMGRAVRSHVDYAVVILSGPDLAHFIAKKEVQNAMNPDTKAQLKLTLELAELASVDGGGTEASKEKALVDMIKKCLSRDEGWKQFYDEKVRSLDNKKSLSVDETKMRMADCERKAFTLASANKIADAVELLSKTVGENQIKGREKGVYLQKIANYSCELNPSKALEIQSSAYQENDSLFCPPQIPKRPQKTGKFDSQAKILEWFREFATPSGAIAWIVDLRARLSYDSSPGSFEEAIKDLAILLGAEGSRPEKEFDEGPDGLWLLPSSSFIIEAKTGNQESLHKSDAEQLLHSVEWFKKYYEQRKNTAVPIIVSKVFVADKGAIFPDTTRVLTEEKMKELLDRLEGFYQALVRELPLMQQVQKVAELQKQFNLTSEEFLGKYTVKIQIAKN